MVPAEFFDRVAQLKRDGVPFAVATVVSRRAPVSSHLGDRAFVFADGRMDGFVGGSCSREIVRKQALEALRSGKPRLVLIRPDITLETMQHVAEGEGIVVPMTCASEGAVDVYLEPHAPARQLLVVGFTPVAEAVAKLGHLLEYDVSRVVTRNEIRDLELHRCKLVALEDLTAHLAGLNESQRSSMSVIVASQGHYDEPALEVFLKAGAGFVGLLASRKRAATVRELLELQGMSSEQTALIRNPIGLNINAKTPAEVAVSILAEVIQSRSGDTPMFTNSSGYDAEKHKEEFVSRQENAVPVGASLRSMQGMTHVSPLQQFQVGLPSTREGFAISPVDGEEIEIASAVHFADLEGTRYFFTCPNCKRRFLKDPQKYLNAEPVSP